MRDTKKIELILFGILVVVFVIMSILAKGFLMPTTLLSIVRLSAELGILAIPMTLILITGGIDLSITSNLALSGVIMGYLWEVWGLNIWVGAIVALCVGSLGGLFNAILVSKFKVPPLLSTLGTWAAYSGLATGINGGIGVSGFPQSFLNLGEGSFIGIPYSLLIWIAFALLVHFITSKTSFGRYLFAIGNNEHGAIYSGVPVKKVKAIIYILAGFSAGMASVIYASRVATVTSNAYANGVLSVVAIAVFGGADVKGGSGTILGTIFATLIIAFIDAGLTLMNIQAYVQEMIIGIVLVGSIIIYEYIGKTKIKTLK